MPENVHPMHSACQAHCAAPGRDGIFLVSHMISMNQHLREWRLHRNMTLEQVANILGRKHTTIARWEKGEIAIKDSDIESLARLYAATPEQLLVSPADADEVARLSRANAIMSKLDADDLDEWFRIGERLARR